MNTLYYIFPFFFILVGIEALISRKNKDPQKRFRFNRSLSNLACGILDQVINAGYFAGFILLFTYFTQNYSIVNLGQYGWRSIVLMFVLVDLWFFLFHMAAHRINILWAAHIVHHHPETYDLTVSFRQSFIATWIMYIFYLPLAFLGFKPEMFMLAFLIFQLYQFIIHTEHVDKLGFLEKFMITPSLHRVHHSREPGYIHTNFGGTFNLWDRVFKTHVVEDKKLKYGVPQGMSHFSPLWANFHYFKYLKDESSKVKGLSSKLKVWLGRPDKTFKKLKATPDFNPAISKHQNLYILVQSIIAANFAFLILLGRTEISPFLYMVVATGVIFTFINQSLLLENVKKATHLEAIRNLLFIFASIFLVTNNPLLAFMLALLFAINLIWCLHVKDLNHSS